MDSRLCETSRLLNSSIKSKTDRVVVKKRGYSQVRLRVSLFIEGLLVMVTKTKGRDTWRVSHLKENVYLCTDKRTM